jgi:hypothetical protein
MEGVALGLMYGLHRMRTLGIVPDRNRVTGGGARARSGARFARTAIHDFTKSLPIGHTVAAIRN